ncbi:MAG: hypothetical protein WC378_13360 [Opitutaceae bacterium]|jgi:hypothetical protein
MSQNKTTKKSAGVPAPRVYQNDSLRLLGEALKRRDLKGSATHYMTTLGLTL